MSNKKKKSAQSTNQMTIFDLLQKAEENLRQSDPHPTGCMNFHSELCSAMSDDITHATDEQGRELTRYDIVARISNLLNREIAKHTLDGWTAPSHDNRVPDAIELSAFVRATGQRRAIECIARHAGIFALPGPEALRAEIRRMEEEIKRKKSEIRKREILLKEVER